MSDQEDLEGVSDDGVEDLNDFEVVKTDEIRVDEELDEIELAKKEVKELAVKQFDPSGSQVATKNVSLSKDEWGFFDHLVKSRVLPATIDSVEKAFAYAKFGEELGFSVMQSMHQLIMVNGRLSLSGLAMNALITRHGIQVEVLEDGTFIYDGGITSPYRLYDKGNALDRLTVVKFTRYMNRQEAYQDDKGNSKMRVVTEPKVETVSFTWKEAVAAGLSEKDVWKKWPKSMLYIRCISIGAKRIAPDIITGLYSTEELVDLLADTEAGKYRRNEDGFIDAQVVK